MNQQPSTPSSPVRLAVRTGLRAGVDTAPNELIEATRNFLQSLLNALPAAPPSAAPPAASTAPAASQSQ